MPQFFIERPIFAWVVALGITLLGLLSLPLMPVAQYPDVAPPSVTISATYPGATAEDVASNVANVIENELNGAKGLLYYESVSDSFGQTQITATFKPGTDPDMAQVDVQNRISNVQAALPTAVVQQGLKVEQGNDSFLLVVTLSSEDGSLDQTELADYIKRNVQNTISRVPGVGKFQLFASGKAMRIWVDPEKLVSYNLSMAEVNAAVAAQNNLISGGILGAPPNPDSQRVASPIIVNGQLSKPEEFENIILRANLDGSSVKMSDIARVEVGSDNYQFGARLNGKSTAAFAVSLTPDANALETAEGIKSQMKELSQFFPDQVSYAIPYDTSPYIQTSIQQVVETLLEAMLLVFVVMYVFLQNIRYTVIPALVVPVAILGSLGVMNAMGFSVNVLTMFAMVLVIGILVDDAIVVVENVERIMAEDGLSPKEATEKAMPQITGAIVGITLVLTVVFLPLAFMSGSVGVIYRQFSVAMAVSIAFSAFLALSFTPALCATILKPVPKGEHGDNRRGFFGMFNRGFNKLTNGYEGFIKGSLKRTGRMMLVYLALVVAVVFMYMRMPTAFLPEEDQGFAFANIELPAGSTANRTMDTIKEVEDYFFKQPQVENLVTVRGFSFNGNGLNAALAFVTLKDFKERKGPENSAQAVAGRATGALLMGLPDSIVFSIVPPAIMSLGNSSGFDVRLEDRAELGTSALLNATQELLDKAGKSPVLKDVRLTGLSPGQQWQVTIDREKAAIQGVDFEEVANLLSTALGSSYLGKYTSEGWVQNVWVQADERFRMNIENVMSLQAKNNKGEMVPLRTVVTAEPIKGPVQIVRYNSYPATRISGAAQEGYTSGDAMAEIERLISELPSGFGYEWTGLSYQEIQASGQSMILMGLSVLVVFMVLAALYESWAIPLSVMLSVPLGVLGSVLLTSAMGMANDVYFQVGIVTIIGLAAKNAILIVEFAKDAVARGDDLIEATVEAARLRFRPILMTSFAFILGVVPLAIASGAGAASQNAVGIGVLGGMLAATPLAVLFVPTFFVVILKLFKTQPKLFGAAAAAAAAEKAAHAQPSTGEQK
ncbi:multidrug efflux RND transporter permease subunit [Alcaligenaceae bacterium 429]|uniref:multidrug efflux RND transporter permease subunit n=1 Tax=Paenalcaligenes sp. Me52 TaxID=3392038 RepID=UPI001091EDA0|nr:multidrug efflux RND transporter permease subunit [Alcaligenaceae bacterium 429]